MMRYYPLDDVYPDAVVVACSDPRFQRSLKGFLRDELKLEQYTPIFIPGSVSSVAVATLLPERVRELERQVDFMLRTCRNPHLVLINHDGCKGYLKLSHLTRYRVDIQ